jgi:hypothetical protein
MQTRFVRELLGIEMLASNGLNNTDSPELPPGWLH